MSNITTTSEGLRAELAAEVRAALTDLDAETAEWRDARDLEVALRPGRDEALVRAVRCGVALRPAGAVVGISGGRVDQIIAEANRPEPQPKETT